MKENRLKVIVLIAAMIIGAFFYKRYNIPPSIELPVMELTDLQGHKVSLQSYAGHPLFLDFFATWCGPCIRELPELADLKAKLADQHLQMVCICDEPIEKLQAIQEHFGDNLIILHSEKSFHDIGIYTYPTNYIFNAQGQKVYSRVNPDEWESAIVINKIRKLIE